MYLIRSRVRIGSAVATILGVIAVLAPQAEASGRQARAGRPDFRLPFPCQAKANLPTYRGHDPDDKKIDRYRVGMRTGSPILASADGYVHQQFAPGGIEIRHGNGWFTVYLHMSSMLPPGHP